MGIIEDSISYIRETYPEVLISDEKDYIVFEGRFVIEAEHDDFKIHIAPRLRIRFPKNYPQEFPITFDVDNKITYDHKFTDGKLCLATEIDIIANLRYSKNISDYIEKFLIPYFISFEYWKETGIDIFGDRSHGIEGIFESLKEFLELPKATNDELYFLLCWAAKINKFERAANNKIEQSELKSRYSIKIAKLRKLGIHFLKKQIKLIDSMYFPQNI